MSSEIYCCYCGMPKGDRLSCCQENHFVPWDDLDADLKDGADDESDYYDQLSRGYARDRI